MKPAKLIPHGLSCLSLAVISLLTLSGCQSAPKTSADPAPPSAVVTSPAPVAAPVAAPSAPAPSTGSVPMLSLPIRIKAGSDGFTDSEGKVWLADQGFADGETDERPGIAITNAPDPRLYQSERYSMTRFTQPLPNGKYIVKLHFCETYDGITAPGDRVFSFNVAGHEYKNFDIWVKAGGAQRAYVETVPVEVTDGQLVITFTPDVENPEINAIEILSGDHDLPASHNP